MPGTGIVIDGIGRTLNGVGVVDTGDGAPCCCDDGGGEPGVCCELGHAILMPSLDGAPPADISMFGGFWVLLQETIPGQNRFFGKPFPMQPLAPPISNYSFSEVQTDSVDWFSSCDRVSVSKTGPEVEDSVHPPSLPLEVPGEVTVNANLRSSPGNWVETSALVQVQSTVGDSGVGATRPAGSFQITWRVNLNDPSLEVKMDWEYGHVYRNQPFTVPRLAFTFREIPFFEEIEIIRTGAFGLPTQGIVRVAYTTDNGLPFHAVVDPLNINTNSIKYFMVEMSFDIVDGPSLCPSAASGGGDVASPAGSGIPQSLIDQTISRCRGCGDPGIQL